MNSKDIYWQGKHAEHADRRFHGSFRDRFDHGVFDQVNPVLRNDSIVVDIGAGTGYLSLGFAGQLEEGNVIAVDESHEMLEKLRIRSRRLGIDNRIETISSDATRTGLPGDSADIVVSAHLLHEVPEPKMVLYEAWRILKPGGILVVQDFRFGLINLMFRFIHHTTAAGPMKIKGIYDALDEIGFADIIVRAGFMRYIASACK